MSGDLLGILPEIIVAALAIALLMVELGLKRERARVIVPALAAIGLVAAFAAGPLTTARTELFGGLLVVDSFTSFFRAVFLGLALIAVLVSPPYLERRGLPVAEYYAMILFSTLGAMTITLSSDLITLFLGLELMSIPVYVLAGMQRRDRFSNEAAMKYFLLGAFSSALLLYGFTWLFGIAGTTDFAAIAAAIGRAGLTSGPVLVALALITVGLGFKAAVVPFHQWTPDAYDGAPTPASAFMSVAPKAAAFAAAVRIFFGPLAPLAADWSTAFALLAVITMTAGNAVALAQRNVKRMLAYSSIAHTGYILAATAAFGADTAAAAGVLFYLAAYGLMNIGAFASLLVLDTEGTRGATLGELAGLAKRHPLAAFVFAVFLVSLTGIPPTVGFIAKVFVLQPVLDAGFTWLAVAIALNAAVAAFYYLRVVVQMYMSEPEEGAPRVVSGWIVEASLAVTAAAVVVLGIVPSTLYSWALAAAAPLFSVPR
ncbi:MAG: NADH-quinone oxidoreductase subunit N [Chloroflexi bacterium]|nr:NADH-quinone oxidoreductase subunit N [Chloroflexota bacterium]